jgi:hypothetical protein
MIGLPGQRSIERPWFGSGVIWGDPAAFERTAEARRAWDVWTGTLLILHFRRLVMASRLRSGRYMGG